LPGWPIDRRFLGIVFLSSFHKFGVFRPSATGHQGPVTKRDQDAGDLFFGTEDDCAPAQRAKRIVHGRFRPVARAERLSSSHRSALSARRRTSAISCTSKAERWPTSIFLLSASICEPVDVHGPRGDGGTTTRLSAPSISAIFFCKLAFTAPRRRQTFKARSLRSSSVSNSGCASIAAPPNRPSNSTLVGPPA